MKKLMAFSLLFFSFLVPPDFIMAAVTQSVTYTLSASVPVATGVSITASKAGSPLVGSPGLRAAAGLSAAASATVLSFDPMSFDSVNKIWYPSTYYVLEIGPTGGPGNTDVTVSYSEGANPNAPGHGLGWKSTATFIKATMDGSGNTIETPISSHGPKRMLIQLNGEHITSSEITTAGWLKIYIGIVTKDPGAAIPDPASSEPFTNADHSGYYDGSLVITATVT